MSIRNETGMTMLATVVCTLLVTAVGSALVGAAEPATAAASAPPSRVCEFDLIIARDGSQYVGDGNTYGCIEGAGFRQGNSMYLPKRPGRCGTLGSEFSYSGPAYIDNAAFDLSIDATGRVAQLHGWRIDEASSGELKSISGYGAMTPLEIINDFACSYFRIQGVLTFTVQS